MSIQQEYENKKNHPCDINEHMETLKNLASECSHITEMGVRQVVSTWAFLAGNPKEYVGIDILSCPIDHARRLAEEKGIKFSFIKADTINPEFSIEETDLLFIDTWHAYRQLIKELNMHANKSRKYIVLHDTTTFGETDERLYNEYSQLVGESTEKTGLWPAVEEFLSQNKNWKLKHRYEHNNGLTVLERV
jgi:hypothetical protein